MTGCTSLRRGLEDSLDVTSLATDQFVCARQRELSRRVVKAASALRRGKRQVHHPSNAQQQEGPCAELAVHRAELNGIEHGGHLDIVWDTGLELLAGNVGIPLR